MWGGSGLFWCQETSWPLPHGRPTESICMGAMLTWNVGLFFTSWITERILLHAPFVGRNWETRMDTMLCAYDVSRCCWTDPPKGVSLKLASIALGLTSKSPSLLMITVWSERLYSKTNLADLETMSWSAAKHRRCQQTLLAMLQTSSATYMCHTALVISKKLEWESLRDKGRSKLIRQSDRLLSKIQRQATNNSSLEWTPF